MIEKVKSAALTVLVVLSVVQSFVLANGVPVLENLNPEQYVQTDPLGSQETLGNLLFPEQLVLHLGSNRHTVLYPGMDAYRAIMNGVKQRKFQQFRRTSKELLGIDWDEARRKQGVEIRFREGLPLEALSRVFQFNKDWQQADNHVITRIWIFAVDANNVRTLLFTDQENVMYEVLEADFTAKDMERFVDAAGGVDGVLPYRLGGGDYYLPARPLAMNSYTFTYTDYTVEQLKRTFFVDPAVTRYLPERDGMEIYTDGKRGLQLNKAAHWMTLSDPAAEPVDKRIDLMDNLSFAVQFINQHGGWNGTYSLQRLPQVGQGALNQAFVFRQYYGSFPIINEGSANGGFIRIVLDKGNVSAYDRSTLIPDFDNVVIDNMELPGGALLTTKLSNNYPNSSFIYSMFPAYRPVITDDKYTLTPVWAVELRDGSFEYLE